MAFGDALGCLAPRMVLAPVARECRDVLVTFEGDSQEYRFSLVGVDPAGLALGPESPPEAPTWGQCSFVPWHRILSVRLAPPGEEADGGASVAAGGGK